MLFPASYTFLHSSLLNQFLFPPSLVPASYPFPHSSPLNQFSFVPFPCSSLHVSYPFLRSSPLNQFSFIPFPCFPYPFSIFSKPVLLSPLPLFPCFPYPFFIHSKPVLISLPSSSFFLVLLLLPLPSLSTLYLSILLFINLQYPGFWF